MIPASIGGSEMGLKLITAPANAPVTVSEVKAFLNVEHSDHDTLIGTLIDAVTADIDGPRGFLGRALIAQTWDLTLDEFPDDDEPIEVPLPPLISVTGVYYTDAAGVEQTVDAADYIVDTYSQPGRIALPVSGTWPTPAVQANAIRIRFEAGYQTADSPPADDLPADLRLAIYYKVADAYTRRGTVVEGTVSILEAAARERLGRHKVYLGLA